MPQLRDAQTSELIAESVHTADLVLLAEELGRDEVLFDGVGEGFNPDAVLEQHRAEVAGLERLAKDTKDPAEAKRARERIRKAPKADDAKKRLEAARKRTG